MRRISPVLYAVLAGGVVATVQVPVVLAAGEGPNVSANAAPGKESSSSSDKPVNPETPSADKGAEAPKVFSYGNSNLSILFLPNQIERMKSAIRSYESVAHDTAPPPVQIAPVETLKTIIIEEPKAYPVFYLASIAYNAPDDWTVWISGRKITSRKNDTDVSVLSINANAVTFLWQPSFSKAVLQRSSSAMFAPTDSVKNRLADAQAVTLNKDTGSVQFTLRQNQSFSVGYFKIFEGFMESPVLPSMVPGSPDNGEPIDPALLQ